jgi:hypothetical protein
VISVVDILISKAQYIPDFRSAWECTCLKLLTRTVHLFQAVQFSPIASQALSISSLTLQVFITKLVKKTVSWDVTLLV